MPLEVFPAKVRIPVYNVNDDRTPGLDVAGLGVVEEGEGADDIRT